MKKTGYILLILFGAALLLDSGASAKDDFPSRPITIAIGYAPGGIADVQGRFMAEFAGKYLGQRMIVEYKAGMSGGVMVSYLARQKADGYTVAKMTASPVINSPFTSKVDYTYKDLTYLLAFGRQQHAISVRSDSPWKTLDDLVDYAKKNPGKLRYGTYSPISTTSLAVRMMAREKQIELTHVPYKSDGQAATALLGGHLEAIAVGSGQLPYVRSGQLRLLAVFNKKRSVEFPDVPSIYEMGYQVPPLSDFSTLTGMTAPKGLTGPPFERLVAAFKKATEEPAFKKMMSEFSCPIEIMDSKEYAKEIEESYKEFERILPPMLKEIQYQK